MNNPSLLLAMLLESMQIDKNNGFKYPSSSSNSNSDFRNDSNSGLSLDRQIELTALGIVHKETKDMQTGISENKQKIVKLETELAHIKEQLSEMKEEKRIISTRALTWISLIIAGISALATLKNAFWPG